MNTLLLFLIGLVATSLFLVGLLAAASVIAGVFLSKDVSATLTKQAVNASTFLIMVAVVGLVFTAAAMVVDFLI